MCLKKFLEQCQGCTYLLVTSHTHTAKENSHSLLLPDFIAFICSSPIHYVIDLPLFLARRQDRLQAYIFQYFHFFWWGTRNLHIHMTWEERMKKRSEIIDDGKSRCSPIGYILMCVFCVLLWWIILSTHVNDIKRKNCIQFECSREEVCCFLISTWFMALPNFCLSPRHTKK